MFNNIHTHMHTHMQTHAHIFTHTHTHAHTHTHTHTHTFTHTHILSLMYIIGCMLTIFLLYMYVCLNLTTITSLGSERPMPITKSFNELSS